MSTIRTVIFLGVMVFLVGGVGAETITKPHNFVSGTTIRSSQMNENFGAIFQELNRLRAALETCQCGGSSSLSEGLVAYYPFNGNANDESGNGNDGTVNGAALTEDRFGNTDSAYRFDGMNDYIDVQIGHLEVIAISLWLKASSPNNDYPQLFEYGKNGNNNGLFHCHILGDNPSYVKSGTVGKIWCASYMQSECPSGPPICNRYAILANSAQRPYDEWQHIYAIFDTVSSTQKLYINGVLEGDKIISGTFVDADRITFGFRSHETREITNTQQYLKGVLDEIRIYNRALSATEIGALYNTEKNNEN